jgi:methionyl-tRNA formyltransferase
LDDGHQVVAVWTQPDRPSGRGKQIAFSPVKQFALDRGLSVHQPARLKIDETKSLFRSHDADVAIVVAYGRILPDDYLVAPRRGCINVHFSLLPLYRGASPVNWAVVNGETETGVTTMFVEPTLDTGPILLQRKTQIHDAETAVKLMERLSLIGADLLGETLSQLDSIVPRKQDDSRATFAPVLSKKEGLIDWTKTAIEIERRVRGFQPWPNAYTFLNSRGLTIWHADSISTDQVRTPGEVISAHADDLVVQCGGNTSLRLLEVQPEAKRRMSARDFLNGSHLKTGTRLG